MVTLELLVRGWGVFDDRVRQADMLVLSVVPVALVVAFVLSGAVRESVVFDYTDPSLRTAVLSPWVHLGRQHLLANLVGYLLVVPIAYVLSVVNGRRSLFFTVFVTVLTVFPPILSYLNLAVPRLASGAGFSGVVLAFAGYLGYAVADHFGWSLNFGPTRSLAPVVFFLGMAIIAPLSVRSVTVDRTTVSLGTAGLVVAALLSALLFALTAVDGLETLRRRFRHSFARQRAFILGVVGIALFITVQVVAFPLQPHGVETTVNLYTHLMGYALGFIVPYLTVQLFSVFDERDSRPGSNGKFKLRDR